MIYLRFSRRRVAALAVLTFVTVWYVSVLAHNATPHGTDRTRLEQPFVPTLPVNR